MQVLVIGAGNMGSAFVKQLSAAGHQVRVTARDAAKAAALAAQYPGVQAVAAAGVKKGVLMKSLRAALLGSLQGPDLLATWLLLHRSGEDRARIQRSL